MHKRHCGTKACHVRISHVPTSPFNQAPTLVAEENQVVLETQVALEAQQLESQVVLETQADLMDTINTNKTTEKVYYILDQGTFFRRIRWKRH